jgi:hypothetical protein
MNKTILICSVAILIIFLNLGLTLRTRTLNMIGQKNALEGEISTLQAELRIKAQLHKKEPKALAGVFSEVINEMNLMSSGTGLNMFLVFPPTKEKNSIESFYKRTEFRGVKGMPLDIKVLKAGAIADVGSALDSVYLLEHQADFKVSEIYQDSQEIRVKGMLYGI